MASIIKRNKAYCVVYNYENEQGETKQKWETCASYRDAQKRKAEVENAQNQRTFINPDKQTVEEFLKDFVSLYGEKKWGVSMYCASCGLIDNYVNPLIGNVQVQSITPRTVDMYIKQLQKTRPVDTRTRKATTDFITAQTIEKIVKLLRCAFKQAVRWELIAKNPFDAAIVPRTRYKARDIWDAETIRKALDECRDGRLYIAMNLSFACSLRLGEILGLTWDRVHFTDEDIAKDNAWIYIDRELERASQQVLETLGHKDIYHVFEPIMRDSKSRIVLKAPKTDSSVRKIWLPKTLAYILREWQKTQTEIKEFLGEEYNDFGFVLAYSDGRPLDARIIEKEFARLKKKANLSNVVFHSLRHSSTTYKLKLNHGDLKATQGDTGHAQIDMITKIYAHILDEDRKVNAQRFETSFYSNPDLRQVKAPQEQESGIDIGQLIEQLQKSPELANQLAALIAR